MMENVQSWKQTTAALYKAVLIFTWSGIVLSIFTGIAAMTGALKVVSALAAGETLGMGFGLWDILKIVATVGVIYGYWLFIQSLGGFRTLVNPVDAPRVGSLRTATMLQIVAAILSVIPFVSLIGGILSIVAWIMLLLAYSALKESVTFPEMARRGASKIYIAMILGIIGWIVGWVPILGWLAAFILAIVSFFMILSGWKCISLSDEPSK